MSDKSSTSAVAAAPQPALVDPKPSDRRRAERHSVRAAASGRLRKESDGQLAAALVSTCLLDTSDVGVGLLHPDPLPCGQRFVLETVQTDGTAATHVIRVTRCSQMAGGRYLIGAELVTVDGTRSGAA